MNLSELKKSWDNILNLTQTMETSAKNETWEEVSEIATIRHKTITEHFSEYPVGPNTAEFYLKRLNDFITKEEKLKKMTFDARKASMKANLHINYSKKAVKNYREAQS